MLKANLMLSGRLFQVLRATKDKLSNPNLALIFCGRVHNYSFIPNKNKDFIKIASK